MGLNTMDLREVGMAKVAVACSLDGAALAGRQEMDRGIMVAVPILACHVHAPTAAGTKEHKDGHFFLVPMGAGQQMIAPAIRLVADFTRPLSHR